MSASHAVIMLTHRETPRLLAHFERMHAQLAGLMPSYLALHRSDETLVSTAQIQIDEAGLQAGLPERYREMKARKRRVNQNYVDVVAFAALSSSLVADSDYVWLMEYDVDFTGNWADMFRPHMERTADLLATRIRLPEQNEQWLHWSTLTYPPDYASSDRLSAFIPLCRVSRRLIDTYRREMLKPGWFGHFEALLPTVASRHGYLVENFAQTEPYLSSGRRPLDDQTYGAKPVRGEHYFHEAPESFGKRDMLYHPIKPGF